MANPQWLIGNYYYSNHASAALSNRRTAGSAIGRIGRVREIRTDRHHRVVCIQKSSTPTDWRAALLATVQSARPQQVTTPSAARIPFPINILLQSIGPSLCHSMPVSSNLDLMTPQEGHSTVSCLPLSACGSRTPRTRTTYPTATPARCPGRPACPRWSLFSAPPHRCASGPRQSASARRPERPAR